MSSVTRRIREIKQPRGGYLKPSLFKVITLSGDEELLICSTLSPITVGLVVDYMSRLCLVKKAEELANIEDIFSVSLRGAALLGKKRFMYAVSLLEIIKKDNSGFDVINACCKLVTFDSVVRAGIWNESYLVDVTKDDADTISKMIDRALLFFEEYGPIVESGITFEGGYTESVKTGDGDFLTDDTLWDFKTSKNKISNKHTLQIYMYYLMGLHSIHSEMYKSLKYIGFYNPLRNEVARLNIEDISKDIENSVLYDVIGYEN